MGVNLCFGTAKKGLPPHKDSIPESIPLPVGLPLWLRLQLHKTETQQTARILCVNSEAAAPMKADLLRELCLRSTPDGGARLHQGRVRTRTGDKRLTAPSTPQGSPCLLAPSGDSSPEDKQAKNYNKLHLHMALRIDSTLVGFRPNLC